MNIFQKYPMPSLRKMMITGAPFTKNLHETVAKMMPHTQILQSYGKLGWMQKMTEARYYMTIYGIWKRTIISSGLTDAGGACTSQAKCSKPGSCGFVTRGMRVKIADRKTGKALGPDQKGEIWIKSEFIIKGYYKNPEQTKEAIDSDGEYFDWQDGIFSIATLIFSIFFILI